jgi:hypothetical protein
MLCIKAWCNIVLLGNTKPGKLDVYSKLGGTLLGSINVSDFNKLDAYHKLEMLQVRASKLMLHPELTSNFLGIWVGDQRLTPKRFAYMLCLNDRETLKTSELLEQANTTRIEVMWLDSEMTGVDMDYLCAHNKIRDVCSYDQEDDASIEVWTPSLLPAELVLFETTGVTSWSFVLSDYEGYCEENFAFLSKAKKVEKVKLENTLPTNWVHLDVRSLHIKHDFALLDCKVFLSFTKLEELELQVRVVNLDVLQGLPRLKVTHKEPH